MKYKKVAIIAIATLLGLAFLGFIGRGIYQVLCISCITPPIKTYQYFGSIDQFTANLKEFQKRNPTVTYKDDQTTGNSKDGYVITLTIEIRNPQTNISCQLNYFEYLDRDTKNVKLQIIRLLDVKSNTGGFDDHANGMQKLLGNFDRYFILPLNDQQHTMLVEK